MKILKRFCNAKLGPKYQLKLEALDCAMLGWSDLPLKTSHAIWDLVGNIRAGSVRFTSQD